MADTKLSALTELAATPADGDEVYIRDVSEAAADESKRITIANLMGGAGGTKEFFVPLGYSDPVFGTEGDFYTVNLASGKFVYFNFHIPADFTSLTSALVMGIGSAVGKTDWTVTTDFAAKDEPYTTHSDSATADETATVWNDIVGIDISSALTGLAAGDYVGAKFIADSNGYLLAIGLLIKYA